MENYASAQLLNLFCAVLTGLASGVFYDLLRALRLRRRHSLLLTHLLDGLYVLFLGAVILTLTLRVGQGELRLFLFFGALGGALLWFSFLADLFRPFWDWWLDTIRSFFVLLWKPMAFIWGLVQKLWHRAKKGFLFLRKYATIYVSRWRRPRLPHHGEEGQSMAKTKTRRRRANPILLLVLLVLIVVVLIQIVQVYTKYDALRAEESALTEQAESLQQENETLRSDLAKKDDPAFWEQLARKFADMVKQGERIFIDPNY